MPRPRPVEISPSQVVELRTVLEPLIGIQIDVLKIPRDVLAAFEPSQIGTIVGTLMDACIPFLDKLLPENDLLTEVGLHRAPGSLKDREGYPDYVHDSGKRLELKLLYMDRNDGLLKQTETPREPSARLTQKVTMKNVDPALDVLMVLAYQLREAGDDKFSPEIVEIGIFSMVECIRARDHRLAEGGGKWFGDYETPAILSRIGKAKLRDGLPANALDYGRKESEGHDYNEDTNFGKLKRIPYRPLQEFLRDCGANYATSGTYPTSWTIT